MIFKKYQSYIFNLFLKRFLLVSIIFFCLVIIINFFDEIRFSEKYNTDLFYIIYLSFLNAPSLIFEIFPFIFLISVKIFYINLNDRNELKILNSNGVSNLKIIYTMMLLYLKIINNMCLKVIFHKNWYLLRSYYTTSLCRKHFGNNLSI